MSSDEQLVRDLIATWHSDTAKGDLEQLLTLTRSSKSRPRIFHPRLNGWAAARLD